MTPFHKKLSGLDALFSTFSDPYGTAKHLLLERGNPPYLLMSFVSILLTLVGPPIWYRFVTNFSSYDSNITSAAYIALTCTAGAFIALTFLILRALRITASLRQVLALCLYSICPSIPIALGLYALSYSIDGSFVVAQHLATGTTTMNTLSLGFLPFAIAIAALFAFRFFMNGVRVLSDGSASTCFFISLTCCAALYGSYVIGLLCVESVYVGYSEQTAAFFRSLLGP